MADDRTVNYIMRMIDNVSATKNAMMGTEKNYQQTVAQTTETIKDETLATHDAVVNQSELAATSQQSSASLDESAASADQATASEEQLDGAVQKTNNSLQGRQLNFMTTMMSVRAMHSAVSLTTNAFRELGLVNDAGIKTMQQFGAGVDLVVAGFYGFKGITGLIKETTVAETALAAVTAFRTGLQSPWALPLILAGAAGLGAIGGYGAASMMNQTQNSTTNNTQIQFTAPVSSSDQRQATRGALELSGGF